MKKELFDESMVILETRAGSFSYGTNVPGSDIDTRGIFVAPEEVYHGFVNNIEQFEKHTDEIDRCIYELRKFMKLASQCNPNVLELLFVREEDVLNIDWRGQMLRNNREWFLSKKCKHTYSGYAYQQLQRIKRHKKWLLDPPKGRPTREEFGLPIRCTVPKDWINAIAQSDYSDERNNFEYEGLEGLIAMARKEKAYFDALNIGS